MTHATWQAVIGLELHVQLLTRSKLFSGAPTDYGADPNAQASAIDLGYPGTLPVPNAEAVRLAVRFGLAIGARIASRSVFARKNYFYPDLPKGYQISQYEEPIVSDGRLAVRAEDGREFEVAIQRAHLEEDAGKSVHDAFHGRSAIDLNRAGVPLLEVVSEPVLHTPEDAVATMRTAHNLVRWLGICDGNMQEGSFRCDANVSVRPLGGELGTRVEIKNVNSFRFVEKALQYEIERQIRVLESGGAVAQETRLYDPALHRTRAMRGKESAHDYRYFPDPDLPPLEVPPELVAAERAALPELPAARRERYRAEFGLGDYDAGMLTQERAVSEYFESLLTPAAADPGQARAFAKLAANWVNGELAAALNADQLSIDRSRVAAPALAALLRRLHAGDISQHSAKEVFQALRSGATDPDRVIAERGLSQVRDEGQLANAIDEVIAANPRQVAQFKNGDPKVLGWLMGQVMRATRGKADPARLDALLRERIASAP